MSILGELALIFGVCLAGEGIAAILPVNFPASVIGLLLLLALLFFGVVKADYIRRVSEFFLVNMAFFFIPSCAELMDQVPLLRGVLLPFVGICLLTTPLVYLVTAWTVQLLTRLQGEKTEGGEADA